VPESDIVKTYRKKSLLIHPDKTKNPKAPDAFDRLKKAHSELIDEKTRERLDEAIADARMLLIREKKWDVDTHSEDLQSDEFKEEWKEKTKYVLMDNEKRRQRQMKAQMQEEGRQQRKEEEEMNERKRKREYEQKWEATRDKRIGSWRDFQTKKAEAESEKKKKKKLKPLA
jgi:DnaJ family protein C protein 8